MDECNEQTAFLSLFSSSVASVCVLVSMCVCVSAGSRVCVSRCVRVCVKMFWSVSDDCCVPLDPEPTEA